MKKEMKALEELKGEKPFKTPEGYFENLTQQIMDQLPERVFEEPKKVSLIERVLPWIYLAAAIAGLGFFFDVLNGDKKVGDAGSSSDKTIVHSNTSNIANPSLVSEEDADYMEYLEAQYTNYILAEGIEKLE